MVWGQPAPRTGAYQRDADHFGLDAFTLRLWMTR